MVKEQSMTSHKIIVGILLILLFSSASQAAEIIDKLPDTKENIHIAQIFNTYVANPQDEASLLPESV